MHEIFNHIEKDIERIVRNDITKYSQARKVVEDRLSKLDIISINIASLRSLLESIYLRGWEDHKEFVAEEK